MKILLIDDDDLVLELIHGCLEKALPDAEVIDYPIRTLGKPGDDFEWDAFDLLLLDHDLGNGQTGTDWLAEFGSRSGFPRTILVTGSLDPRVVGRAVASGASGYLNKMDLAPEKLAAAVLETLAGPDGATPDQATPEREPVGAQSAVGGGTASATRMRLDDLETEATYRMRRVIGRGAMSSVYLAERVEDGLTVAIKVLDSELAEDPSLVERFALEGEIVAKLDSPYIVRVYEHGFTDRYGYIAMEFFGRGDLKQQIALGIAPGMAVEYLYNVVCGLRAIQDAGIVHRDLKPANVMFRSDGTLALVDFGVAKSLDRDLGLTATGAVVGTPHYLSPEQALGEDADSRSDIYAAGAIFHEMLTGHPPYASASLSVLVHAHVYGPVPRLADHLAPFQPLLDLMMAKDPAARVANAADLLDAIIEVGMPAP